MPVLTKGSFSLNLGIVQLGGELSEFDRQCAWELYTELTTRVALTGKQRDQRCDDFSGEILVESLSSVHSFFREARGIMRTFPVGKLRADSGHHLGILVNDLLRDALRPFLEKWQAKLRHWWEHESNPKLHPFARQREFPELSALRKDWIDLRRLMRGVQKTLVKTYALVEVTRKPPRGRRKR